MAEGDGVGSDGRFRAMFERSADAVLLLDTATNRFVEYNQATLDMLRCSRDELSALHPSALSPPRQPDGQASYEKANVMIATAVRGGSHRFEWVHRSPRREDFPVEVLLTPLQEGPTPLLMVVWRDITERRRAEEALRNAQKLESLGVLASGIAHDFNNLLTAILGHLGLARLTLAPGHDALPHLGHLEVAARQAADLTRQMLAYSGRGAFRVEPLDLGDAVREMASLLAVSLPKGVRVERDLPAGLPTIEADRSQLQQVILNLVTNAAEAIGEAEGLIALRTSVATLDAAAARTAFGDGGPGAGTYVALEVRDTGCGMTPEVQARIFDPFFSTKRSGRGLGLSALQGILKAHRAGLVVRSEVGRGSTFQVHFPASDRPLPPRAAASPPGAGGAVGRGTALLVEDEELVRRSSRAVLEHLGFEVLEAPDGAAGLAAFLAHRERIAWVLMDLTMPRMDGHEALRGLRRLDPTLPVVLTSGWAEVSHLAARFADEQPSAFLPKPFTAEDVEAALARAGVRPAPARPAAPAP